MKSGYKFFFLMVCNFALLIFVQAIHPQLTNNKQQTINELQADSSSHLRPDLSGEVEQSETKPDYRNRLNIPEYDPSLMPLNYNNRSTGVWTELNPKVPRVDYLCIDFVGVDTGWAVGAHGAIIKTADAGSNWKTIQNNINTVFLNVDSYNGNLVLITAYDGIILRSINGGENFQQVTSGVGNGIDLWGLKIIDDTLAWICGLNNTLLKTTDAGLTWELKNTPLTNIHYWAIDFYNKSTGYIACDDGNVLKTSDGGDTWTIKNIGENKKLYTLVIKDSNKISVGGQNGRTAYSSNGGDNWILGTAGNNVNSISFANDTLGYAVGDGEYWYYRTTDGGISWQWNTKYATGEFSVKFVSENVGYEAGKGLTINKTYDGGYNWVKNIWNDNFYDVHFINETTGFAISGAFYKTTNSGLSWERNINAPGGYDILFIDSLTGFVVNNNSTIYKTTDGGTEWYLTNVPVAVGDVRKIFFINQTTGWATSGGRILKTTDSGENWVVQHQTNVVLTSIYFIDSLNGWTSNINGRPFKTTDGGMNWVQQNNLNIWESDDVYFLDSTVGFIIDNPLKLYKTLDGGNNWLIQLNSQYFIRNFSWITFAHGFIIGDGVFETSDSGNMWFEILELRNVGLRKFHAPLNYLGYSVGNQGLIVKYIDSSYVPVELVSFTGHSDNDKIIIKWTTASETNNSGFEIEKSNDNENWKSIGFVIGNGSSNKYNSYSFIDNFSLSEKNYYRLRQVDYNGTFEYSNVIVVSVQITICQLFQNYPNPFNSSTIINYQVPIKSLVNISLYDIKGEKILELVNNVKEKGLYKIELKDFIHTTGIYFVRMATSTGYSSVIKISLIK